MLEQTSEYAGARVDTPIMCAEDNERCICGELRPCEHLDDMPEWYYDNVNVAVKDCE